MCLFLCAVPHQAASMASLLLAAGEKGHRRTLPHRCEALRGGCTRGCRLEPRRRNARAAAPPPPSLPPCCSRVMLHQPSGGAQGQASDIAIAAKEILKMRELLNGLYVKHTGQDAARVGACGGLAG